SSSQKYGEYYRRIVEHLKRKDHKILSDHIMNQNLDKIFSQTDPEKVDHYKKVLKWINQADVVVAEASFPSTVNVGHEISLALEKSKPVVVLYKKGHAPIFLEGIQSEKLFITEYTDNDLEQVVVDSIEYAAD